MSERAAASYRSSSRPSGCCSARSSSSASSGTSTRRRRRPSAPRAASIEIRRGADGHYHWPGKLNGRAGRVPGRHRRQRRRDPGRAGDRLGLAARARCARAPPAARSSASVVRADLELEGGVRAERLRMVALPRLAAVRCSAWTCSAACTGSSSDGALRIDLRPGGRGRVKLSPCDSCLASSRALLRASRRPRRRSSPRCCRCAAAARRRRRRRQRLSAGRRSRSTSRAPERRACATRQGPRLPLAHRPRTGAAPISTGRSTPRGRSGCIPGPRTLDALQPATRSRSSSTCSIPMSSARLAGAASRGTRHGAAAAGAGAAPRARS